MNTREVAKKILRDREYVTIDPDDLMQCKKLCKHGFAQRAKHFYEQDKYCPMFVPTAKLFKKYGG